jgi:hypothetical protein
MGQELLLRKATGTYATSDLTEGVNKMTRTQADKFIDMTINESVMMREGLCTVHRVDHRKGRVARMKFGEPVTYGATEGTQVTRTVKPDFSYWDYDTSKLCSAWDINSEVLEVNNEGRVHEESVMSALATRMGHDFEYLGIQGDTVKYSAGTTATDLLLKTMNGWYKLAQGGLVEDLAGASVSKTVFSKLIRKMPNHYKQQRSRLRFFCSPSVIQDWRDSLASRNTDLGDASMVGSGPLTAYGIPLVEVPLIPENLNSYDGSTAYGNGTFVWLTFPENFTWIISRDIETYMEFVPRYDQWQWTLYTYMGFALQNLECMVMGVNLRLQGPS